MEKDFKYKYMKYKTKYKILKKYQPGDRINITFIINDKTNNFKLNDKFTITHFDGKYLYTCGHCFPKNASTNFGKLIYSSGFDTKDEKIERAIIEIKTEFKNYFFIPNIKNISNYKNIKLDNEVYMINNNNKFFGRIFKIVDEYSINPNYIINPITKISKPYIIIIPEDNYTLYSKEGFSGSPWYQNNILLGSHIGKAQIIINQKKHNIVYIKPIKIIN